MKVLQKIDNKIKKLRNNIFENFDEKSFEDNEMKDEWTIMVMIRKEDNSILKYENLFHITYKDYFSEEKDSMKRKLSIPEITLCNVYKIKNTNISKIDSIFDSEKSFEENLNTYKDLYKDLFNIKDKDIDIEFKNFCSEFKEGDNMEQYFNCLINAIEKKYIFIEKVTFKTLEDFHNFNINAKLNSILKFYKNGEKVLKKFWIEWEEIVEIQKISYKDCFFEVIIHSSLYEEYYFYPDNKEDGLIFKFDKKWTDTFADKIEEKIKERIKEKYQN